MHRKLNLRQPKRFSEKIQYYKAFYHNNDMLPCVDKYQARKYVEEKLRTNKYLVPLYQVCENANQIDFSSLPQKFVIKTTDGGNGANVYICKDKNKVNISNVIDKVNSWRNKQYYIISREWAYKGAQKSRVIVESLLESNENKDGSIDDYKFLCFDGKFRYLWIDKNRYSNHKRGFWDEYYNFLPHVRTDMPTFSEKDIPILPSNIREMQLIAEQLSEGFPFARIDLYNIHGTIYFGEITFYPWSGYIQFTPDRFDFELGSHFHIN